MIYPPGGFTLKARGSGVLQQPVVALINCPFRETGCYQLPLIVESKQRNTVQHTVWLYSIEVHKNIALPVPYPVGSSHTLARTQSNRLMTLGSTLRRRRQILTDKNTRQNDHQCRFHCRPDNPLYRNPGRA